MAAGPHLHITHVHLAAVLCQGLDALALQLGRLLKNRQVFSWILRKRLRGWNNLSEGLMRGLEVTEEQGVAVVPGPAVAI